MGTSGKTPRQRTTWHRVIGLCAGAAVCLTVAVLIAQEALLVLVPFIAVFAVFALLMGLVLRRQPRG